MSQIGDSVRALIESAHQHQPAPLCSTCEQHAPRYFCVACDAGACSHCRVLEADSAFECPAGCGLYLCFRCLEQRHQEDPLWTSRHFQQHLREQVLHNGSRRTFAELLQAHHLAKEINGNA